MARYKVKDENLIELAEIYNAHGRKSVYEQLESQYGVKNPYFVFRRMCENPDLSYDSEKDHFEIGGQESSENIFMSMEELCSPIIPQHVSSKGQQGIDSRPAAMDSKRLIINRVL